MRRAFSLLVCLLIASQARAQPSAVDAYIAARDHSEAALAQKFGSCEHPKPALKTDAYDAEAQRLDRELEPLLRQAVGRAVLPRPFSGEGEFIPGLGCGLGADALDGLVFSTGGAGGNWSMMVVSTPELLRHWLRKYEPSHPAWQANPDEAFGRGDLTTDLIGRDSWREVFARLPIDKPAGVDAAFAVLGEGGNGDLMWPPRMISFYVRKGDRIFLVDLDLDTKFTPIEACGDPNKPMWSVENAARFNDCWKQRGAKDPAFAAAGRQAQAFVNALATVQFSP